MKPAERVSLAGAHDRIILDRFTISSNFVTKHKQVKQIRKFPFAYFVVYQGENVGREYYGH